MGVSDDAVWVHLYGGSTLDMTAGRRQPLRLVQKTDYPWDGRITVTVEKAPAKEVAILFRVPGWAGKGSIRVNGQLVSQPCRPASYVTLAPLVERRPRGARFAHGSDGARVASLVEESRNHVAVMRGPLVYCLESVDLPAGVKIDDVRLPRGASWNATHDRNLLAGVTVLQTEGRVLTPRAQSNVLYRPAATAGAKTIPLRLIPYYAWSNRGRSEMAVWIPAE